MFGDLPVFSEVVSWEDAQTALMDAGLGDGLPLVVPTERRLMAMLANIVGPERSRGLMPPLFGDLTPAAAAFQCVLAGCRPAELPVVLTAAEACLEPRFNLLGLLTTTGTPAIATVVHGPVRGELGFNASTNCLGPGNRVNACVGRAISLVLRNIAGARELVGDMATMGQPGKYTFCFAEQDDTTIPPFHLRAGCDIEASAVTVLGTSGTAEILPDRPGGSPEHVLHPLARVMQSAVSVSGGSGRAGVEEQVFLLPPELANLINGQGWDLSRLQEELYRSAMEQPPGQPVARDPGAIQPIVCGGAGVKMTYLPLWAGGTLPVTRRVPA